MPGIYIHIPFCKQACYYCNFHFSTLIKYKEDFIQALKKEIFLRRNFFAEAGGETHISTVYFGGGTPSLLNEKELNDIFQELTKYFEIDPAAEITLEANPDDLAKKKLIELKRTPVNRLSIGIQSFFDEDLQMMNRAHNAREAINSILDAKDKGFKNISIDLIYGLPLLTNEKWRKNLQKAFEVDIQHISCYNLTIEEKTLLYKKAKKGEIKLLSENQNAEQFVILTEEMYNNSFMHYEISNFCKEGFYSIHNSSYWKREHYLGLGPSAHSFNTKTRSWNIANNQLYIKSLSDSTLAFEEEKLGVKQHYNEYVMTSLRTMWGCDLGFVENNFGESYLKHIRIGAEKYFKTKQLIEQNNKLVLTNDGKLVADAISSDLFCS